MRLLIAEDDALLADGIAESLRAGGYAVDVVDSAARLSLALEQEAFDLVLLDIGLPDISGFDVLARLRGGENYVPVIVVTARDAVADRVRGLDLGADDYLVKPFAIAELEARVRALIRRRRTPSGPVVHHGRLTLDLVSRQAKIDGESVVLTQREWALLELLVTQAGTVLSKDRIIQSLSSWDEALSHNAIEVYVSRLRVKFAPCGVRIRTVRGFGYCVDPADVG
jgi:two-component system OmpR family response regulator